ncbi:MAG: superoxide dismutase family protein [Pseudolabrys sp.]
MKTTRQAVWHFAAAAVAVAMAATVAPVATPALAQAPAQSPALANAVLKDKSGKEVGEANLTQTKNGVLIRLSVKGIEPGEHAFHVHAVGKCEAPFTSAGGHFNPASHKHGLEAPEGAHAGDMPNLHVPQDGTLTVEVFNTMITLAKGQPNSVFDADGSALVIHAKADDNKTDPAGDAGDRIACGVVTE